MLNEKKVKSILRRSWQSTGKIATLSSVNYYIVEKILKRLYKEGIAERMVNNKGTYWKLK